MAVSFFSGLSNGFTFVTNRNRELESLQGDNYYFSSLFQGGQIVSATTIFQQTAQLAQCAEWVIPALTAFPIIATLGLLLAATVKHEHYEKVAKWLPIPSKLSGRATQVLQFCSKHTGDFIQIAAMVSSIALIILGSIPLGVSMLIMQCYSLLESHNLLPFKVALFAEKYLPLLASFGLLLSAPPILQFAAAIHLASSFPATNRFLLEKVDALIRKIFTLKGPSFVEIEQEVVVNKEPTFAQISTILLRDAKTFEVNPAHCAQMVVDLASCPKDDDFDKFLKIFDKVDWKSKYKLLRSKLLDDDHFIDLLHGHFTEIQPSDLSNPKKDYLEQYARAKQKIPNEFAAEWAGEQMVLFVDVITKRRPPKGSRLYMEDAIQYYSHILPYLDKIANQNTEFEDALLKLAIEGGDYCARDIKRVASELITPRLIYSMVPMPKRRISLMDQTPDQGYELYLKQFLQEKRGYIVQAIYKKLMDSSALLREGQNDVHTMDLYRGTLSFGFSPLTQNERREFDLMQLFWWEWYSSARADAFQRYNEELDEVIKKTGELNFTNYMERVIGQNTQLSQKEKDVVMDMIASNNNNQWQSDDTVKRFHQLGLVMLGVLRSKSPS